MEELASLCLRITVMPALPALHKDLLTQEEVLNPYPELCFIPQNLDEVPLGGLPVLLDAVQKLQGYGIGGSTRSHS